MSDDEVFIRAIVDRPGDDTSRLVYADWLDDRDDPRGAYLRAEFEWARPWRSGERPADSPALREPATGLDPVWIARVSRPPLGVCCDHVRFSERGPILGMIDIEQVEQRLGGQFSEDFRAFLLNYNGGTPVPACLPYPERAGPAWAEMDLEIGRLYTASRPGEEPPEDSDLWDFEIEGERDFLDELYRMSGREGTNDLIADMVPFADTMHDLGYLLIGVGKANRGWVYHFRDYCHFSDDPGHLFDYAATFAEFLTRLRPDRDS
jgi:uncharacterized protein (TIGR02996 family)